VAIGWKARSQQKYNGVEGNDPSRTRPLGDGTRANSLHKYFELDSGANILHSGINSQTISVVWSREADVCMPA